MIIFNDIFTANEANLPIIIIVAFKQHLIDFHGQSVWESTFKRQGAKVTIH